LQTCGAVWVAPTGRDRGQAGQALCAHPEHVLPAESELLIKRAACPIEVAGEERRNAQVAAHEGQQQRISKLTRERERPVEQWTRSLWGACLDRVVGGAGVQPHEVARAADLAKRRRRLLELRRSLFQRDR
jgi:hypothetical protein